MDRIYTIVLDPEDEGGFAVTVPAFPEVATYGDTEEQAVEHAREAIQLALEVRAERGEPIPGDSTPKLQRVTIAS